MNIAGTRIPEQEIRRFCQKWNIHEFALFGSILRDDFGPESDVDILISFNEKAKSTLFDMVRMKRELMAIFGKEVDLISRKGLEASRNHIRRDAILKSAEKVYVA